MTTTTRIAATISASELESSEAVLVRIDDARRLLGVVARLRAWERELEERYPTTELGALEEIRDILSVLEDKK